MLILLNNQILTQSYTEYISCALSVLDIMAYMSQFSHLAL